MTQVVLGILVGGKASRLGGIPKGLLPYQGQSVVSHSKHQFLEACPRCEVVLLGENDAYSHLEITQLPDEPAGSGPLAGVVSLLRYASKRSANAVLLGCDMPYVNAALFSRLLIESAEANILAPRSAASGKWETLFSRLRADAVLTLAETRYRAGQLGLQGFFDAAGSVELPLSHEEQAQLGDWDTPNDVANGA
jgi:molybdopterin-guanine dinucleotide biosynthesis protein A